MISMISKIISKFTKINTDSNTSYIFNNMNNNIYKLINQKLIDLIKSDIEYINRKLKISPGVVITNIGELISYSSILPNNYKSKITLFDSTKTDNIYFLINIKEVIDNITWYTYQNIRRIVISVYSYTAYRYKYSFLNLNDTILEVKAINFAKNIYDDIIGNKK